jgi:hypothetical protein
MLCTCVAGLLPLKKVRILGIFRNPDSAHVRQFLDEEVKLDHYLIRCVVGRRVGSWVRADAISFSAQAQLLGPHPLGR